jgi:hypothetical protein
MRHTSGDDGEDDDDDEQMTNRLAATFNSKNQSEHLKQVVQVFGVQFDEWCVCLIGDNAAVNIKTAELCKKQHVGCKNHKLNLEVNAMLAVDNQLTEAIESVQKLMLSLKTLKHSAALSDYTYLRPTLYVRTRWSGKHTVCAKFLKLYQTLIRMREDDANLLDKHQHVLHQHLRKRWKHT